MDYNNYNGFTPENDAKNNKGMAILAYFGLLILIPMLTQQGKQSPFVRFHVNQGLILLIIDVAFNVINAVLTAIFEDVFIIGTIISLLLSALSIVLLVLMIMGVVHAAKGEYKELPIVGAFRIYK